MCTALTLTLKTHLKPTNYLTEPKKYIFRDPINTGEMFFPKIVIQNHDIFEIHIYLNIFFAENMQKMHFRNNL